MKLVLRVALWMPLVVCVGCLPDLERECDVADDCPAAEALCVGGACTLGAEQTDAVVDLGRDGRPPAGDVEPLDEGPAPDRGACVPTSEVCNALDDDCDGVVDEGPDGAGLTRNCYDGPVETQRVGACRVGTSTCMGGTYGRCVGQVMPVEEACEPRDADGCASVCNNVDEDCDGVVDEGLVRDCYAEEGQTSQGECEAGSQMCESGSWSECVGQVPPSVEICDGLDNDCDGIADNVGGGTCECTPGDEVGCYGGEPDTENVGPCVAGTQTCTDEGMLGACMGQVLPGVEVCNGVDDDCDGPADEALGGQPCSAGRGACERMGRRNCEGAAGLVCDAVAGMESDEVCNRIDDDCDGQVDEDTEGAACLVDGERCQPGEQVCNAMGVLVCQPNGAPVGTPEVCNDIDDDCDDRVDELDGGRQCVCLPGESQDCYDGEDGEVGVGACRGGRQACEVAGDGSTDWGDCVGQTLPAAEICDGVDADCDGVADADDDDIDCPAGPFGTVGVCNGQACTLECAAGFDNDDDGDPSNGCLRGCGAVPGSVEIPGANPINGFDVVLAARAGTDSWAAAWMAANDQVQFSHRTGPGLLFSADPADRGLQVVGLEMIGVEQGYTVMIIVDREGAFGAQIIDIGIGPDGMPMQVADQLFPMPTRPILVRRPVADGPDRQLIVWTAPNEEVVAEEGSVPFVYERTFGDSGMAGAGVALAGGQPAWDGWPALAGAVSGDGAVLVGTCGGEELCALRVDAAAQTAVGLPPAVREVPSRLVADGHPDGLVAGFMAGAGDNTFVLAALGVGVDWSPPLLDDLRRDVGDVLYGDEGPIALVIDSGGPMATGQAVLYGLAPAAAPTRIAAPYPMTERSNLRSFVGVMSGADRRVAWIQRGIVRTTRLPCR